MKSALIKFELAGAEISIPEETVRQNYLRTLVAANADLRSLDGMTTPPRIGQEWPGQGGIFAGIMRGENGNPDYYLIVPTHVSATMESISWGGRGKETPGADSAFDGLANTLALVKAETSHPAAEWASNLVIGGHGDFYLPARRELSLCYANVPELFERTWHWSSTQYSARTAWVQAFDDGCQHYDVKGIGYRARAVRRIQVSNFVI